MRRAPARPPPADGRSELIAERKEHLARRAAISDADALVSEVRAWSVMGMNVFLGLRFGVWGHEDPLVVARHANALLRNGMKA